MSVVRARLAAALAFVIFAAPLAAFASSASAAAAAARPAASTKASSAKAAAVAHPDQVVVVSLTDTKAKYNPCGCHVPKGGWARQAFFTDSLRALFGQLVFVDNGGFFPDAQSQEHLAEFFMEGMGKLGLDAIGVGDRDLRYGLDFLVQHVQKHKLPAISSNLVHRDTKKPVFPTYALEQVGGVKVGIFSLVSPEVDLGPSRDALGVREPMQVAGEMVRELRARGATVVVLLSQLGKVGSEDVPLNVEGIDLVIGGRNVPLLQRARSVNGSLVVHGGEQGQYIGRSLLTLDAARSKVVSAEAELVPLTPEVASTKTFDAMIAGYEAKHGPQNKPAPAPPAVQAAPTTTPTSSPN
jgi:2',3'-cyclic-nucleotide 2'-phosphodiesterase (5'-nucleotidase family)